MKNKEKYSLDKLRISVTYIAAGIADIKIYHGINCVYYKSYSVEEFTPRWITDFMKWLEEDDEPTILTDKEKAYLSVVIKPFREKVEYVYKKYSEIDKREYLEISLENGVISFPYFEKGKMYKGMGINTFYKLEELGL